ncbi:MAG: hypothetical protein PWR26_1244 [Methanosarcinales archaeon]|uniref:glycosyltransferase family 4 protein n=1 Tax=Methermicoccus shengliensis TaxID=660064 RepID=UPI0005B2CBD5|nr:glycosyltransferase family 4 protein [Methermicoccus shengliensis]MDI3488527.1 hypothetical protein [Methanosarcinales archaeon]
MRILHLYDGHERVLAGEGSVPTVVYELARHTARLGHEVVVLERRWRGLDHHEERDGVLFERFDLNVCPNVSNAVPVYTMMKSPLGVLRLVVDRALFALKARRYLDGFDVVHVHLPFAANVLLALDGSLGKRMVYTVHADEYRLGLSRFLKPPLVTRAFSPDLYLMRRVKKSVLLNESIMSKIVEKGIKKESLEAIPNGVNLHWFDFTDNEGIKNSYGFDDFVVLFVGTLTPRKGVEYLVKALHLIGDEKVQLVIAGNDRADVSYSSKIKDYVERKRINVRFMGFLHPKMLKGLYAVCDVFVLPSLEEGFGMVLTEAMASGKPLVGTRVGGIPMQIRDGWNGFLVEPANEEQLAERIEYLIENEEERKRMGKNSRRLAEEEFSWERIAKRYVEVYEEVSG